MTRSGWDDSRLDNAFEARAAESAQPPADLTREVIQRLARVRPARAHSRRGWLAAAAGIVVLVGLGAVVAVRPGAPVPLVGGSATPGATQPTTAPLIDPVSAALGEPITVSAAIAVRDGTTTNGRELVVAGYLSPLPTIPCPLTPAADNPTLLRCPHTMQWVMERWEFLGDNPPLSDGGPPKGPSFRPSFALVEPPTFPAIRAGSSSAIPVVLSGHFHDRRAALCKPADEAACGETFVVDRVVAVDGAQRPVTTRMATDRVDRFTQATVIEHPRDLEEDVDRLVRGVVPQAVIASRQLVTIDRVIGLEPVLADDEFVPYIGNPATLVWIVTVVDLRDGVPVARTFALFDASSWFAEVTADGAKMIERRGLPGPAGSSTPRAPSEDPSAFDGAPETVLGVEVRSVAAIVDKRRSDGATGRDEYAIRAWYVGPNPAASCDPAEPLIHQPSPPCDERRHWLLDHPESFGVAVGQLRRDPAQWPNALNPIVRVDMPFDVPDTWVGGAVVPQPVVVLGHFNGVVDAYHGNVYFVLDAVVWTRDLPIASIDAVTRLTPAATEDPSAVRARIDTESDHPALATWMTVVDAGDFAALEPGMAGKAPEFTTGNPVWVLRRLTRSEQDGRQRLAVERAYTADGGARVWLAETPDSDVDLATTIDVGPFGEHTRLVQVYDYGQWIVSVRRATAADKLRWQPTNPKRDGIVEVARGATDRDVGIRWSGGACAPDWRVLVNVDPGTVDPGPWIEPQTFGDFCPNPSDTVTRALVITFDRPIDLDRVRSSDGSCCG